MWLVVAVGAVAPAALFAEVVPGVAGHKPAGVAAFNLEQDRLPMASLDGEWRFHPGDDPQWAGADFDDSSWPLLKSDRPWSEQGYARMGGYAWYRFRLLLPDSDKAYSIGLGYILTGYQVYEDGVLVGSSGSTDLNSMPSANFNYSSYPVIAGRSAGPRTVVVAIRVYHSPIWASYEGGGPQLGGNLVGLASLVGTEAQHRVWRRKLIFVDLYAYSIAATMIGMTIFGLFLFRPKEREYLWFSVVLISQAVDAALNIVHQLYAFPVIPIFDLLDGTCIAVAQVALMLFLTRVMQLERNWIWKTIVGMAALSPLFVPLYWPGWISVPVSALISVVFVLPSSLWMLGVLIRGTWRRELTARLLLIPVLAVQGLYVADNVVVALYQFGVNINPQFFEIPFLTIPYSVHESVLANLVFLLAMLGFLIRRFTIGRQREERLEGSLEAARQVQSLLVPEVIPQIPGFWLDCVYRPAESVGGDFFQILPIADGGLLVVVGDVAGKGLPAAMMVSMVVGALRAEVTHTTDPARLLSALNERMVGRSMSSLTTCLCAVISREGLLQISTAGHLPPYRNGEEVPMPGALPLGMLPGATYETVRYHLACGDRLVFLSDGVVEARSQTGALLGFESSRALTNLPAAEIADAAVRFGQEDDITVVTVAFCPVMAPAETA